MSSNPPDWFTPVEDSADMLQSGQDDAGKFLDYTIEHKDGVEKVALDLDMATFKQLLSERKQLDAIRQSYSNEAARLGGQEQQLRAHPIANILANVAGAMAETPKMPGWVQSLGKTARALNPTPDELMSRRFGMQEGIAGILSKEAGVTEKIGGVAREMQLTAGAGVKAKQVQNRELADLERMFSQDVKGRSFDPVTAVSMYTSRGLSEDEARVRVEHFDRQQKLGQDHDSAVALMKDKADIAKESRRHEDAVKMEDIRFKHEQELVTQRASLKTTTPKPPSAAEIAKMSQWQSGWSLLNQTKELVEPLKKSGMIPGSKGLVAKGLAKYERTINPNDPDWRTFLGHVGTMVSVVRALGDIGRAQSAYKSLQDMIENPPTKEGLDKFLGQLSDALLDTRMRIEPGLGKAVRSAPKDHKEHTLTNPETGEVFTVKDGKLVGVE